jgi:hypothetical protein
LVPVRSRKSLKVVPPAPMLVVQHLHQGGVQASRSRARPHAGRWRCWGPMPAQEQGFIGIDVAHARHQGLVEQGCSDRFGWSPSAVARR